jgi:hypothetical protein
MQPASAEYPAVLGALIVLNWPIYILAARIAFRDTEDLKRSLWYVLVPDFVSWLRGKWWEDQWGQARVFLCFLLCGLFVWAQYAGICRLITWLNT